MVTNGHTTVISTHLQDVFNTFLFSTLFNMVFQYVFNTFLFSTLFNMAINIVNINIFNTMCYESYEFKLFITTSVKKQGMYQQMHNTL